MVSIKNISKSFRDKSVLSNFSMEIKQGQITGFMGESGKGKSTLANILCGVVKVDSGTATIQDIPLIYPNGSYNNKIRPKIQIIPQQPYSALDPKQKIIDSICEPILHHKIARDRKSAEDMAEQLFKQVWLGNEILYRFPHQISGGQAQRVVIARALGVNPTLLISDEATSMLDLISQGQILDIYNNLINKRDMGILFISHNQGVTSSICNNIYNL